MSDFSDARDLVIASLTTYDSALTAVTLAKNNLWDARIDMLPHVQVMGTYDYTNVTRGRIYEVEVKSINVDHNEEEIDIRVSSADYGLETGLNPENLNKE